MAEKTKTIYVCSSCGAEFPKWSGQCKECGEWNTLEESVKIVSPAKGLKAKATVNEEYMEKLYDDISSLYRLNRIGPTFSSKADLGPLPTASVALLVSLACIWLLIGIYALHTFRKNKKKH